jgi:hypothetical protein
MAFIRDMLVAETSFPRPEEFGISVELQAEDTNLTVGQEAILTGVLKNLNNEPLSIRITVYSKQPSPPRVIEMEPEWAEEKTLQPFEEMQVRVKLIFEKANTYEVGLMIIMPDTPAMTEPIVFKIKEKPVNAIDILWMNMPIVIVVSVLIPIACIKRIRTVLNAVISACYLRISTNKDEAIGHFTIFILTLLTLLLPMLPEEFAQRIFIAYLILLFIGIPILAFLDGIFYKRAWASFTIMFTSFMLAGLIITSIPYFSLRVFLGYLYFGFITGAMGLGSSFIMFRKKPIRILGIIVLIVSILLWVLLILPTFQNIYLTS